MITHNPRRRVVLRGALASGCALGIPLLLGCKKADTPTGAAAVRDDTPADTPAKVVSAAVSAAMAKLSREEAHYQDEPRDDQRCGNCLHFIAESNTCKVVEGEVSPDGWCMLWTRHS